MYKKEKYVLTFEELQSKQQALVKFERTIYQFIPERSLNCQEMSKDTYFLFTYNTCVNKE